jgi:hypothetical protein
MADRTRSAGQSTALYVLTLRTQETSRPINTARETLRGSSGLTTLRFAALRSTSPKSASRCSVVDVSRLEMLGSPPSLIRLRCRSGAHRQRRTRHRGQDSREGDDQTDRPSANRPRQSGRGVHHPLILRAMRKQRARNTISVYTCVSSSVQPPAQPHPDELVPFCTDGGPRRAPCYGVRPERQ